MNLSLASKRMIIVVCISAFAFIVAGVAYHRSVMALFFAFGVILTSGFNICKVFMLERAINKTLEMSDPETGKNYIRLQYLLRYFLTGVVLLAVGLIHNYFDPPFISIWGAIAGVSTLQIAVIAIRFMKLEKDN